VTRIKLLRSGQGVFLILARLTSEGCSASTSPNDVYAGVYDAVIWTRSVRGSEPYNNLGVEGASYTRPYRAMVGHSSTSMCPAARMGGYTTRRFQARGPRAHRIH